MARRPPYRALGDGERDELIAVGHLIARGLPWQAAWDLTPEQGLAVLEGIEEHRARGEG